MPSQTKPEMERRTCNGYFSVVTETRDGGTEAKKIIGHAAIFNTVDGPEWFREKIEPGAFKESIVTDDVRALFNHDPNFVLGRNRAGTLTLTEDDHGLRMEIDPPDTQFAHDLLTSIERGDISQASFAFKTVDAAWDTIDGQEVRTLKKVKLYDVSPVTYPFYQGTEVALRTRMDEKKAEEDKQTAKANLRRRRIQYLRHL